MKSQAEHTGAAADGWESVRLGEIFDVGSSKRVLQKHWKQSGVPFYRAREIVKLAKSGSVENDLFISEQHFSELQESHGVPRAGDLMVSAVGTLGACYVVQPHDRFYFKDASVLQFRPTEEVEPRFFQYLFLSDAFLREVKKSDGATVGTLTITRAKALSLNLPPLEEQKRIVAVLDQAFAALDRARANAEANLADAVELFETSLTALFSANAADEKFVELSEIANLARGHNPPKKDFIYEPRDGYFRFYQIRDRKSDRHAVYVPNSHKLHTVRPDEILMSAYRHIGEVFRGADGAFNVALCKLSSKSESTLLNDYLFAIIPTDFVKGELLRHSERSLIPSMSIKHLETIKIPLPNIEKQRLLVDRFDALTTAATDLKEGCHARIKSLDDLRQSILQKAFDGELT